MPTEYAEVRIGADELPAPSALLRAFREPDEPNRHPHRVLVAAHQLVECHERRYNALRAAHAPHASNEHVAACSQFVENIDRRRTELIGSIDKWVADNVEHRAGAALHTETLGSVIDRMAAKWITARDALGISDPDRPQPLQVDGQAHLQWCRLAELADGYKDLITDVIEHRRRLPVW